MRKEHHILTMRALELGYTVKVLVGENARSKWDIGNTVKGHVDMPAARMASPVGSGAAVNGPWSPRPQRAFPPAAGRPGGSDGLFILLHSIANYLCI
jgi:hypothetical protein